MKPKSGDMLVIDVDWSRIADVILGEFIVRGPYKTRKKTDEEVKWLC